MGPARLKVQLCAMHLKEQADIASRRDSVMAQRALVLEESFFNIALDNRGTEPFGQRRTQDFWQIFGGKAAIAIGQTDPQVHVVFLGVVHVDTDQEVGRDLALLAQHLDVRRDQGEGVLAQRPREQGIGLLVLPRLGENRVQVQHEVLAVQTQFAFTQITTDQTADIARSRRAVGGVKTDLLQVGGEAELLIVCGVRAKVGQHIAQRTRDVELVDDAGHAVGPGCERVQQGRNRRQVQVVGLKMPTLRVGIGGLELLHLRARLPAQVANTHGQRVQHHVHALITPFKPGMQGDIFKRARFALCISAAKLRCIQTRRRALYGAVAPVEPKFTASL